MDKLYVLIKEQFPEFVLSDYPKFVEFVQAYYKWLEQALPQDLQTIVDIDNTPDEYLKYFIDQLDVYGLLTRSTPYNKTFIKHIKELYTAKGTEDGLLFLLKAVYDSDVSIDYPIQYVLKPSDGKWVQEKFITLRTYYGSVDTIAEWDFSFNCRCAGRRQPISVTRTEILDQQTVRFYFQQQTSTILFIGQRINVYNSVGGLMYTGTIIPSPSRIDILNPGQDWQLGQVIIWPGTDKNTIIRVADVNPNGTLKRIEIVEYGYDHNDGEAFIISPYPIKPISPTYLLTQTQLTFGDPPTFEYNLDINDVIDGISDDFRMYASGLKFNSYLLEGYQEDVYVGSLVASRTNAVAPTPTGVSNVTLDQWLSSRATLRYTFDVVGSLRGKWTDESSHLSTDSIRLQDSFYYQQFSYVIESAVNPSVYKDLAASIHLASTKMFTKFNATSQFKIDPRVLVTFPFVRLDILDVAVPIDSPQNAEFTKLSQSSVEVLEEDSKHFQKLSIPPELLTSTDAVVKHFFKYRSEDPLLAVDDKPIKTFTKTSFDSVTNTDRAAKTINITKTPDVSTASDVITRKTVVKTPATDATNESTDSLYKTFTLAKAHSVTSIDGITSKSASKLVVDTPLVTDYIIKTFTLQTDDDAVIVGDEFSKLVGFIFRDSLTIDDPISKRPSKLATDSSLALDNVSKLPAKYTMDGVLTTDSVLKRPTHTVTSSVEAFSLDAMSATDGGYFITTGIDDNDLYSVRTERYAEVLVTATN